MPDPTAVLIVEDHAVFSEALSARIDRESDIEVVGSTDSSAQALLMVESRRPNVVLLDVELGDDNGVDLIQQLLATRVRPKAVILTCRSDTETVVTALRLGASAFVPKSAPIDDLLLAIRTVAGGDLWVSPAVLSRILPDVLEKSEGKEPRSSMPELTDREREVLSLMVDGLPNSMIAERLHLSIHTVRTHAHNVQRKLNVHSKLAAVALAHRIGIRPA